MKESGIVVERNHEPGARRKTMIRSKDTECRVKAALDVEKRDPAWWDKYEENLAREQKKVASNNEIMAEKIERERQLASIKLQRLPGGILHGTPKDNIRETVFETEAGFRPTDLSPLPSTSAAVSAPSSSPLEKELKCSWETETSEEGEEEAAKKPRTKSRASKVKGKKSKPSKDHSTDPPSYSQVVDEVKSLRPKLKEAQDLNELMKWKKKERKERKERREKTPTPSSYEESDGDFLPADRRTPSTLTAELDGGERMDQD